MLCASLRKKAGPSGCDEYKQSISNKQNYDNVINVSDLPLICQI